MIYSSPPADWKELQSFVCEIFNECGYMTESPKTISTVRSEALEVDVYVKDNSVPRKTIICECKYWDNKIPQSVVHAFRAQISNIGANMGLLISKKGFQAGAFSSAKYSNIKLLTWNEFETIYETIWYKKYFLAQVDQISDAFIEYNEPINSRVFRKADALSENMRQKFINLRKRHFAMLILCSYLSASYYTAYIPDQTKNMTIHNSTILLLPLINNEMFNNDEIPNEIKRASSYKQLLSSIGAICNYCCIRI